MWHAKQSGLGTNRINICPFDAMKSAADSASSSSRASRTLNPKLLPELHVVMWIETTDFARDVSLSDTQQDLPYSMLLTIGLSVGLKSALILMT